MSIEQLITLALVQGITEFLPISSSGHLILIPLLTEWPDQGLLLDVAVHVGTLGAVMAYLWADVWRMVRGAFGFVGIRAGDGGEDRIGGGDRHLVLLVIIATIPVVLVGLLVKDWMGDGARSLAVIGWAMFGFGVLLYAADRWAPAERDLRSMDLRGAVVIGLFQALALIPGTSRAGITMTAARFLGFERTEAARFSMILSIPTILAAGSLAGLELVQLGEAAATRDVAIAMALSFVSAFIAILLMMRWLRTASFTPFVVYRLVLGAILLGLAYT
ncbi:MAG: undecaprenyl-diphosphate phosphatase [Geminicoccaceae bacterium]